MPIEVLFSDITFTMGSFGKNEPINYGIVNVRNTTRMDVVIIRNIPTNDKTLVSIPDPERGVTEAVTLRRKLYVLSGNLAPGGTANLHLLDSPKVIKEIEAERVAEATTSLASKILSGEVDITTNVAQVDGIAFKIIRFKSPTSREDFDDVMVHLYMLVAGRKRILVGSPAFVEVVVGEKQYWCVTSIPRVVHYLWESPSDLVVAGVVDPGGFNAPFLVVRNVSWRDLADYKKSVTAVRWLGYLMSQIVETRGAEGVGATEEGIV